MTNTPIVPIVTYHTISDTRDKWQFRHLSCPISTFENHLKAIRRGNFKTITLKRLYEYMAQGEKVSPRSLVLTFDDGYLDNWVFAYPLLKKYGLTGTIFVSPDFVDPSDLLRPNLEDVWTKLISLQEFSSNGFLNWCEMKAMEDSGVMDIQSHALTHTWYFASAEIIDFHHPGDKYPWLVWNAYPERKHLWMTEDQRDLVPWGTPVYRHEKSLVTRRYFPDDGLDRIIANYVRDRGNEDFFLSTDWRQQLQQVTNDYRKTNGEQGRFETDIEYKSRLLQEMAESKRVIEKALDKKVDFLCWPGGGYTDAVIDMCKKAGYLASVHSSWDHNIEKNQYGANPTHFSRISPPMIRWNNSQVEYKEGLHLVCLINSIRGNPLSTAIYKALKIPFKLMQLTARGD